MTEPSALVFHEETKHSELSLRTSSHYLDWDNRPYPFKIYESLPLIALPHDFPRPLRPALDAIRSMAQGQQTSSVDSQVLAELLFFSAGLTRKVNTSAGMYYMRAAPATGALYPIELYVVCADIPGLKAGVYHFNPLEFGLVKIRGDDYTGRVCAAAGRQGSKFPLSIVFTSVAWRNAWKYEARSYRHWFWDSGVIAANLLATSSSASLPIQIDIGFSDRQVSNTLGLSRAREAPVALAHVGIVQEASSIKGNEPPELDLAVRPLSREEVEYPIIWKTNEDSALQSPADVAAWRGVAHPGPHKGDKRGLIFNLKTLKEMDSVTSLEKTILQRGSTRRFAVAPISFEHLSMIIRAAASPIPLDFLPPTGSLIDLYFIANQIEGLPSGSYRFHSKDGAVEQLRSGRFRDVSGYLCLNQPLFADASAVFFLMTDLQRVTDSFGNRGYRAAQFEAGIRAGKIYLASYALGNGASGSTFYDDAVTEFFSPAAKGLSTMVAVGVGVPSYKARPGKILVPRS